MVTVISNPTTSFQLLIPSSSSSAAASHVCKITSKLNVQKPNCLTNLSCFSKKRVLFQSQSQLKLGSRFRRSVVSCGGVAEIDQTQFSEIVLKSETPVLVEFVADWCGPCKLISPAIEWASKEYEDRLKVVKINHDLNPQLIEEYKVYGLPALIIFKNGKEVPASRREGAMTKAKLKDYIDAILESAAVI